MPIYAADLSKIATQVKSVKQTKKSKEDLQKTEPVEEKPKKSKKVKIAQEPTPPPQEEEPVLLKPKKSRKTKEHVPETNQTEETVKPKRKLSEKQLENLRNGRAAKAAAKAAAKKEAETKEPELKTPSVQPPIEKNIKRKRKVKTENESPTVGNVEPIEEPKQKRKRPDGPPQWFTKYVEGVEKERAAHKEQKVPAKEIKQTAQETASKSWENGLTRDRVQNEIDSHMNRMYSMIFNKR